jgi:glutamine cyclotransferase
MLKKTALNILVAASLAAAAMPAGAEASGAGERLRYARPCRELRAVIVRQVAVPRFYHEGLCFNGKEIWLCNGDGGMIWVVDPGTGQVRSEIKPVSCFVEAVTPKGDGTYYTTEWDDKCVYLVALESDALVVKSCASVAPAHPAGAVWNGARLYVVAWERGITGTRFSILEMDGGMNVMKKVPANVVQEACQLAWDGNSLWMTSWYDRKVFRIDTASWEITGYFRSPVDKTTGIAWDGRYLWVTGTSADLYQMSLSE